MDRPEWVLISTSIGKSGRGKGKGIEITDPFDYEIFFVKLDGSLQVKRVAHSRSRRTESGKLNDYWNEPHATTDKTGNLILFSSPWVVNGIATDTYDSLSAPNTYLVTLRKNL